MKKFSQFTYRHIGSNEKDHHDMLKTLNSNSLDDLLKSILPKKYFNKRKIKY